jgi:hypothetical protein
MALVLCLGLVPSCTSKDSETRTLSDHHELVTDTFHLEPGEEQYQCYATTLDEDFVAGRFDYKAETGVHHFLVARTPGDEPDGMRECGTLFRFSWLPLFGAGSSDSSLVMPEGAGEILPAGTQILIQLHLLNPTTEPIENQAHVTMQRSTARDPEPVGIYAFGTDRIDLAPGTQQTVVDTCEMKERVELFAVLPHMHFLGQSLTFETGSSESDLHEIYRRDPWSFDSQILDDFSLTLEPGLVTRTTCRYQNDTSDTVGFGESSHDEMCFLVGFAVGRDTLGGCLTFGSDGSDAGAATDGGSCEPQPNDVGIGAPCTQGGDECAAGLSCTADQTGSGAGFCLQIGGCTTNADCGGGEATCCAPAQAAGALNICVPESCRPADCDPV